MKSSEWTLGTLYKYLTSRIDGIEKAIDKAEAAADERAKASNEIRAAMVDQQKNFADKQGTDYRFGSIENRMQENMIATGKRLDVIERTLSTSGGRSQGIGATSSIIFQVLAIVISVLTVTVVMVRHL